MYIAGLVIPVPEDKMEADRQWAENSAQTFRDCGRLEIVECWEDNVPDGKQTDFPARSLRKPTRRSSSLGKSGPTKRASMPPKQRCTRTSVWIIPASRHSTRSASSSAASSQCFRRAGVDTCQPPSGRVSRVRVATKPGMMNEGIIVRRQSCQAQIAAAVSLTRIYRARAMYCVPVVPDGGKSWEANWICELSR